MSSLRSWNVKLLEVTDTKVSRGRVTKQGSRLLRWALIEAVQHVPADTVTGALKQRIIARRGTKAKNIAKVAAARHLLTLVSTACATGRSAACPRPLRTHRP